MSIKTFTEKQIILLSNNQYVMNVSDKAITYTDEFKRIFMSENEKGKLSRLIFEEHGFDIDIIGMERAKSSGKRWRRAYRKEGILGLSDMRKEKSGRPIDKELTNEQKIERYKAQIKLLKAENELLKKIDCLERRMIKKK
jgi:transposase